jgi:integrase
MSTRQLNRLFHEAADAAGIRKGVTLHALRHNAESRIMPSNLAMPLRSPQTKASVRSTGA